MTELEEKQGDCPYCHSTADLNDTANSEFQVSIDLFDPTYPNLEVRYDSNDYDCMAINYCPKCGRKLGEDE